MNTKRITYLAATLALATAAASCEHEEIYEPLEFSVRLAPTNTYRTGDPVVFNFSGNADFITVWTGDTGHEYKHRNRTKVDIADIESCELEIEISQQYGTLNNLDLFAGNKFAGLNGSDAATDRPVVEAIAANDCADWTKLEFTPNNANKFETRTYDITRFADRFRGACTFSIRTPRPRCAPIGSIRRSRSSSRATTRRSTTIRTWNSSPSRWLRSTPTTPISIMYRATAT